MLAERVVAEAKLLRLLLLAVHGAEERPALGAYSDVIRSAFRRHSIAVPKVSDQRSGASDHQFRSFDHPFRSFDRDRPSG
jgi:hypothetical protein